MNQNSFLCRFLAVHPENWETLLREEYGIKVKKDGDYAIFNYHIDSRFSDPVVQEARGIILDCQTLEVICWPFRKFGNFNESYADTIDWASARVQEKVDGSIIKLWFDHAADRWQFSTNATIRAEYAPIDHYPGLTYGGIITRCENYRDIPFDTLDRNCTYIFELVAPETKVVVSYEQTMLYHLGTRHNITGRETDVDIGIRKPRAYPLTSLDDCLHAALMLNRNQTDGEDREIENEGFVVVDKHWHRVKIKSPDYLMMHRLKTMRTISKQDCVTMLLEKNEHLDAIMAANPALVPLVKFYDYQLAEMKYQADRLGVLAKNLYREYSGDRGAVAKILLKHKLSAIGFRCLASDEAGGDILLSMPIEKLLKLIPEYVSDDFDKLFLS